MLFCGLIISLQIANAQAVVVGSENFDGSTHTFTSTPGTAWTTSYNPYNLAVSGTKSIWSEVPFGTGDSVILTSPIYDCSNYAYVSLRFSHICKVSPMDEVRVEYRLNNVGAQWQALPANTYKGGASNYGVTGFNAASYTIWNASDSLAMPANSWWKEEMFDLSNDVSYSEVQIRFIIKKGNVSGTQISHGWVIDNFELSASMYEIKPPVVEFQTHYGDTVGVTGPYTIRAKVAARTAVPIVHPVFNYTASHAVVGTHSDSMLMTPVEGDSIWEAVIPQHIFGTTFTYYIYGHDSVGNYATARSGFYSKHMSAGAINDSIQIGSSVSGGNCIHPWATLGTNNWTRTLYHASDVGNTTMPVSISGIAYVNSYSYYHVRHGVKCYIGSTTDNAITSGAYEDPIAAGATLVYSGDLNVTPNWNKVTFQRTATIPAGQNVVVYWIDTAASLNPCSQNSGTIYWSNNSMGYTNVARYGTEWSGCNGSTTTNSTLDGLPTTRMYFGSSIEDSNSVALETILMADSVATSPSTQVPVKVSFRNKGYADLHSAVVNWWVNGVAQTPYT